MSVKSLKLKGKWLFWENTLECPLPSISLFQCINDLSARREPGNSPQIISAAETPMQKEEYLMKRILGCAVVVMLLGAAPLLAKSVEGNEYDKGKTLYKNKCQFCHGISGDGKGLAAEPLMGHPVDFTNSKFWQDDVEKKIEDTIKKGKEMMPAFDLETDEIKAIIWYMSHTFKKATQNNN